MGNFATYKTDLTVSLHSKPGEKPQERFFQSREDENANRIVQADEVMPINPM